MAEIRYIDYPKETIETRIFPLSLVSPIVTKLYTLFQKKWMVYFFNVLFFIGCTWSSSHYHVMITPSLSREILSRDSKTALRGKLWDRSQFFLELPFHLVAMSLEQEDQARDDSQFHQTKRSNHSQEWDIIQIMSHSSDEEQRRLVWELLHTEKTDIKSIKPPVPSMTKKDTPYMKMLELEVLSKEDDTLPPEILTKALQDQNEFVRMKALSFLAKEKNQENLLLLHQYIQDSSPFVRAETVKILGVWKYHESLPYIQRLLSDPEKYVRDQASESLHNFY